MSYTINKKINPLILVNYIVLFFIITSKELLSFRLVFGIKIFNIILYSLILLFFISIFIHIDKKHIYLSAPKFYLPRHVGMMPLIIVLLFLIVYLLIHEIVLGDGFRSIKYIIYILILVILSFGTKSINLQILAKIFVWIVVFMSIASILQTILVASLDGNDVSRYDVLTVMSEELGRSDDNYRNPYNLGLLRDESLVSIGPLQFRRANGYTTEPKYFSLILWVALISSFYIKENLTTRVLQITILGTGLFISYAYTSALIILISFIIYLISRWLKGVSFFIAIFSTFFLSIGIYYYFGLLHEFFPSAYANERINSLIAGYNDFESFQLDSVGMMGIGFDFQNHLPSLMLLLGRYGYIGLILYSFISVLFVAKCIDGIRIARLLRHRISFALIVSTVMVFFGMFMPEFITPLLGYIFAIGISTISITRADKLSKLVGDQVDERAQH